MMVLRLVTTLLLASLLFLEKLIRKSTIMRSFPLEKIDDCKDWWQRSCEQYFSSLQNINIWAYRLSSSFCSFSYLFLSSHIDTRNFDTVMIPLRIVVMPTPKSSSMIMIQSHICFHDEANALVFQRCEMVLYVPVLTDLIAIWHRSHQSVTGKISF